MEPAPASHFNGSDVFTNGKPEREEQRCDEPEKIIISENKWEIAVNLTNVDVNCCRRRDRFIRFFRGILYKFSLRDEGLCFLRARGFCF